MERNAVFPADLRNLRQWIDRPDLVIDVHQTDQRCAVTDDLPYLIGMDTPFRIRFKINRAGAVTLQGLDRVKYRMVFDTGGDDLVLVTGDFEDATNGAVIALCTATGKDYLRGFDVKQ